MLTIDNADRDGATSAEEGSDDANARGLDDCRLLLEGQSSTLVNTSRTRLLNPSSSAQNATGECIMEQAHRAHQVGSPLALSSRLISIS